MTMNAEAGTTDTNRSVDSSGDSVRTSKEPLDHPVSTVPASVSAPISVSSLEPRLARTLSSLCLQYRHLSAEIDERNIRRDELKSSIEDLILSLPYKKILGIGWNTRKQQKTTHTLNNQLLVSRCIELNLDPILITEIIAYATEEKKGKEYITITDESKPKTDTSIFD